MIQPLLFGTIGWTEVLIIVLIILLLFGAKKIPDLMKGMGKGVRSFKEGMNGVDEAVKDEKTEVKKEAEAEEKKD